MNILDNIECDLSITMPCETVLLVRSIFTPPELDVSCCIYVSFIVVIFASDKEILLQTILNNFVSFKFESANDLNGILYIN